MVHPTVLTNTRSAQTELMNVSVCGRPVTTTAEATIPVTVTARTSVDTNAHTVVLITSVTEVHTADLTNI